MIADWSGSVQVGDKLAKWSRNPMRGGMIIEFDGFWLWLTGEPSPERITVRHRGVLGGLPSRQAGRAGDAAERVPQPDELSATMRSHRTLLRLRRMVEGAEATAQAISEELARREAVLAALRTLIEARADLAKAGYALVPLDPTEAMLNAGWAGFQYARSDLAFEDVWRAMVAAFAEQEDPA